MRQNAALCGNGLRHYHDKYSASTLAQTGSSGYVQVRGYTVTLLPLFQFTFMLPFATMNLFCGECRTRRAV